MIIFENIPISNYIRKYVIDLILHLPLQTSNVAG